MSAPRPVVTEFAEFAAGCGGPPATVDYHALWRWSVQHRDEFWAAVTEFFDVDWARTPDRVSDDAPMPATRWFPGGRLNYTHQVFRRRRTGAAVVGYDEGGGRVETSWADLEHQVAALAATFTDLGVRAGDRVVGYLPDRPEAVVAFLASASLGAVWAGCGTDLEADAAIARLAQLSPRVLVAASGHRHRGSWVDRTPQVEALRTALPHLRGTVLVGPSAHLPGTVPWPDAVSAHHDGLHPTPLPADHPLWVLFSSGTTGVPKGILHSHAGVVVEHLKTLGIHLDVRPGDQFFWYTTLNWMLWNLRTGALLRGATVHCFDGAPTPAAIWELTGRAGITHLGVSPGFLAATQQQDLDPTAAADLAALRMVGCTGSVLTPTVQQRATSVLGPGVVVASTSGGTDVVSAFVGAVPTVDVPVGEIAVRCLGVDLHAFDADGHAVVDEVGELVVTSPMPSMPVGFWNDPGGDRLRATYFDDHPGVWRHGDRITLTSRGSVVVHGRSDATLNRHGIRMGSADICEAVERVPGIREALVVGIEEPDGGYWMPLFVTLTEGTTLDAALARTVKDAVRTTVSPRHVPDDVIQVSGIPHTHTGKKLEVPVKNMLTGHPEPVQPESVDRPELLAEYDRIGEHRRATR
ncbi:acetoacetate--CoA ligase [Geodermatophilus sp. SYSU D01106]